MKNARIEIDATTRQWIRKRGLTQSAANRISQHLFGLPFMDAIAALLLANGTPYGTTPQGARRELARVLASERQFDSVRHLFMAVGHSPSN